MGQEKKQWNTDLVGWAVLFVELVTLVCGGIGFGLGVVAADFSFGFLLMAFGAIVGLGLSIGLVLAIKYLLDRRKE